MHLASASRYLDLDRPTAHGQSETRCRAIRDADGFLSSVARGLEQYRNAAYHAIGDSTATTACPDGSFGARAKRLILYASFMRRENCVNATCSSESSDTGTAPLQSETGSHIASEVRRSCRRGQRLLMFLAPRRSFPYLRTSSSRCSSRDANKLSRARIGGNLVVAFSKMLRRSPGR